MTTAGWHPAVGGLFHAYDRKPLVAPLEVGPHLGAATAAPLTDEPRLEIGKAPS